MKAISRMTLDEKIMLMNEVREDLRSYETNRKDRMECVLKAVGKKYAELHEKLYLMNIAASNELQDVMEDLMAFRDDFPEFDYNEYCNR
jgi:hypothetical protein